MHEFIVFLASPVALAIYVDFLGMLAVMGAIAFGLTSHL